VDTPENEDVRGIPSFPEDPNERIRVFFDLSWNEFVQLATAVDVGSDIAYGVDGLKVWWVWVRSLNDMQICEAIIDCLTNDAETREAFSNFVSNQIQNNTWLLKTLKELADQRVTITTTNCNDGLFATIKQTIQYVDTHTLDWLQKVEDSGLLNAEELFQAFTGSLAGSSGAYSLVLNFTQWILDNLIDAYRSVSTSELIDVVSCEIFCLYKDNCDISVEDIAKYFSDRVNAQYPYDLQSLGSYLETMINIVVGNGGRFVFDVMMNNFFTALKLSNFIVDGTIGGMYRFRDKFDSFTNDADADWQELCTDCVPVTAGYINVNAETIDINGVSTTSTDQQGDGYNFDVNQGDVIAISISGQIGCRFNTSGGIFGADPLTNITITNNGGGMNVYNRTALIGTGNGTYSAGFINADNTLNFIVNYRL
jgi:hypothetical protein